jgi:hypothetical protein
MRRSDLAYGLAAAAVLALAAPRVWPIALTDAHVAPVRAALQDEGPGMAGMAFFPTLRELQPAPAGGWLATVTRNGAPQALLAALDARAMAEPGASRIGGSLQSGRITSDVGRFPLVEGRAQLAIWSRPALPLPDLGRNEARLRAWLAELKARAPGTP